MNGFYHIELFQDFLYPPITLDLLKHEDFTLIILPSEHASTHFTTAAYRLPTHFLIHRRNQEVTSKLQRSNFQSVPPKFSWSRGSRCCSPTGPAPSSIPTIDLWGAASLTCSHTHLMSLMSTDPLVSLRHNTRIPFLPETKQSHFAVLSVFSASILLLSKNFLVGKIMCCLTSMYYQHKDPHVHTYHVSFQHCHSLYQLHTDLSFLPLTVSCSFTHSTEYSHPPPFALLLQLSRQVLYQMSILSPVVSREVWHNPFQLSIHAN